MFKKFIFKKFFLLCLILFGIFISQNVQAATLYFSPSSGNFTVGNIFTVNILVNTEGVAINNAEATINFPNDLLELVSISKSGSIFSLWVEEPIFSNSVGTLSFNGGLPTPGFNGPAGKILSAVFRVKNVGSASLIFSSAAVRANDGYGTNIFKTGSQSFFNLISGEELPSEEKPIADNVPQAPKISSPTHPDPNKWYANKDAKFTWPVPSDVTGTRLLVDKISSAIPTVTYVPAISEKEVTNLDDGIWYFHVQLRNVNGWGEVSHFRFQIDTKPPQPFEIKSVEGKETTNPQPTLVFGTTDEMSGVDYYEVKIDQEFPIKVKETEYKMPVQIVGKHTVTVKAVDKAGNYTLVMTEINILPIEKPVITDYPRELLPGSILPIKGTALPDVTVMVYIQKDKNEIKTGETKSDKDGRWTYIIFEPVEKGIYKVWAEDVDSLGARSEPSEKVTIQVIPPVFIRIGKLAIDYPTTVIILLVVIGILIFTLFLILKKIEQRKRKLRKEITKDKKALYQAFKILREEIKEQIEKLDGEEGLSEREKKICDDLKKALKISEEFIGKEIKDIEKEINK
ncbi:MAG: hypothetical protein ACP5IC_01730 [Minisyncoccia bacterium]